MPLTLPRYVHKLTASWADMDFNAHMANTAYLNRAVDARMAFLTENGLPLPELMRLRVSWVVMKDEVEYRREIKWMEEISITVALAGLAPDSSRFKVRNEFFRADGHWPKSPAPAASSTLTPENWSSRQLKCLPLTRQCLKLMTTKQCHQVTRLMWVRSRLRPSVRVRPNPSLKRSANGRPPGPGRWYAVHFHRPGPGVLPLPSA